MIFYKQNFLKKELSSLYEKGLLSKEQKDRIFLHYNFTQKSNSLLFAVLAGFLFSLSLITLAGFNWERIPSILRTTSLLSLLLICQIALYYFKDKNQALKEVLGVVSNFILLANLALLSQIYHLGDDTALAILSIAFVSMLFALILQSYFVFIQAYLLAVLAFGVNLSNEITMYSFIIFIILGFVVQMIKESKILAFVNFFSLCVYLSCVIGTNFKLEVFFYIIAPLLSFFFLALNARSYQIYALLSCAVMFLSTSYLSTTDFIFYDIPYNEMKISWFNSIVFFAPTLLCLFNKRYFLAFLSFCFYFASCGFLAQIVSFAFDGVSYPFVERIYYSFLSLILSIYLIKNNYKILGILTLFALVIIRYVDLLGDYIGASIIFALFGFVLLLMAFRKRSKNEA